ncbi:hypothetical protein K443DRAFT_685456, partial [Laccaria amethystina LaAM-08-1]
TVNCSVTSYDHTFNVREGAVGTFKIATGQSGATDGDTGFRGLYQVARVLR